MESAQPQNTPKPRTPIKRPMAQRPPPPRRKARKPNWIYIAGCVLLMGAFFTPWFSTPIGSVYGFEICYWVPRILVAFNAPAKLVLASNIIWVLAFIGVFAFFGLGMELASLAKHKNQWWLRLLTAISPILAFMVVLGVFLLVSAEEVALVAHLIRSSSGEPPARAEVTDTRGTGSVLWALIKISGWGAWVMLAGMLLCVVSVRVHPGRKRPKAAGQPAQNEPKEVALDRQ